MLYLKRESNAIASDIDNSRAGWPHAATGTSARAPI